MAFGNGRRRRRSFSKRSGSKVTRSSSATSSSYSNTTPKPPPSVRRKVRAIPDANDSESRFSYREDVSRQSRLSEEPDNTVVAVTPDGAHRVTPMHETMVYKFQTGATPKTLPFTPSLLSEETAPSVPSRGNATASLSTALCNNLSDSIVQQLWSPVYLSVLEPSPAATIRRKESWGKFLLPGPERMVRESVRAHFDFHISRCALLARPTFLSAEEETSSQISSVDLDTEQISYQDTERVDDLVSDFLITGNVLAALSTYKMLLKRQKTDLQKAGTLQKLGLLCLYATTQPAPKTSKAAHHTKKCKNEALHYSQQSVRAYRHSDRPLQAAMSTFQVALVQFSNNKVQKALQSWREGIQRCLTAASYDHPYISMALNNLGVLHYERSDTAAGVRSLNESLELQKTLLGAEQLHLDSSLVNMAVTMGNIALTCERQKRYERTISMLQEALSLYESVSGGETEDLQRVVSDHLDRLVEEHDTRNRGDTDTDHTIPSTAVEEFSRSSGSTQSCRSERMFGNVDGIPDRRAYMNLNMQMSDNHDFLLLGALSPEATAEQRVRQTVLTWFGKRVNSEFNGTAFLAFDKEDDAEGLGTGRKESIPVDLDGDAVVDAELYLKEIHRQAVKHLDRHEIEDAVQVFTSTLQSHQRKFGENHHLVGSAWHNIGMVYMFAKDYTQARRSFQNAIRVRSAALGADHPDVACSVLKIGLLQLASGDDASARSTFWSIRDMLLRVLGYGHPQLAKILNNIGVVYYQGNDRANARRCFQMAHDYQKTHIEDATADTSSKNEAAEIAIANTLANLGFIFAKEGENADASRVCEESLTILRKYYKEDDPQVTVVQENINYIASRGILTNSIGASQGLCVPLSSESCVADVFLCGR